jgi:hypothetical protein
MALCRVVITRSKTILELAAKLYTTRVLRDAHGEFLPPSRIACCKHNKPLPSNYYVHLVCFL